MLCRANSVAMLFFAGGGNHKSKENLNNYYFSQPFPFNFSAHSATGVAYLRNQTLAYIERSHKVLPCYHAADLSMQIV